MYAGAVRAGGEHVSHSKRSAALKSGHVPWRTNRIQARAPELAKMKDAPQLTFRCVLQKNFLGMSKVTSGNVYVDVDLNGMHACAVDDSNWSRHGTDADVFANNTCITGTGVM